jgi:hypothetical protein
MEKGEMDDEDKSDESGEEGIRAGNGLGDGTIFADGDVDDLGDLSGVPSGDGGRGVRGDSASRFH